jgi:hypothetical protein
MVHLSPVCSRMRFALVSGGPGYLRPPCTVMQHLATAALPGMASWLVCSESPLTVRCAWCAPPACNREEAGATQEALRRKVLQPDGAARVDPCSVRAARQPRGGSTSSNNQVGRAMSGLAFTRKGGPKSSHPPPLWRAQVNGMIAQRQLMPAVTRKTLSLPSLARTPLCTAAAAAAAAAGAPAAAAGVLVLRQGQGRRRAAALVHRLWWDGKVLLGELTVYDWYSAMVRGFL